MRANTPAHFNIVQGGAGANTFHQRVLTAYVGENTSRFAETRHLPELHHMGGK